MDAAELAPVPAKWGAEEILRLILSSRFRFGSERELQDWIEALLAENAVPYSREFILSSRERIDFLCGSVGIEVKINSSRSAVERQLWRYANDDRIEGLILVTTLSKHTMVSRQMLGKPIFVAYLLYSLF